MGERERRKLRARQRKYKNVWFGFSIFGLVGWSVALPAILGTALGQWIDRRHPGAYSWTMMLMIAGLALGCLNAWNWMRREREAIDRIDEDGPEQQNGRDGEDRPERPDEEARRP